MTARLSIDNGVTRVHVWRGRFTEWPRAIDLLANGPLAR